MSKIELHESSLEIIACEFPRWTTREARNQLYEEDAYVLLTALGASIPVGTYSKLIELIKESY